ncbi:MAG: hypothetical protein ACLFWB_01855 [Armatimonadota bacterium]
MSKRTRAFTIYVVTVLVVCGASVAWGQMSRIGTYRLQMTVTPSQLPADGQSSARVHIEVRTASGSLTTDQVNVIVRTSLGSVSTDRASWQQSVSVRTTGGVAVVYASSETAGSATLTAQIGQSRESTYIRFFPEGEEGRAVSRVLHVSGDWVGYSVDTKAIEASGNARVRMGDLTVKADDTIRVDTSALIIQASEAVVQIGDTERQARQLYLDISRRRGVLRRFSHEGIERIYFNVYDLATMEQWEVPKDAFRHDHVPTDTWLVAEGISYFVGQKIVIRHGEMWVGSDRILKFPPLWVIGLPGYQGTTNTQMLQVDSTGELGIDIPFFYHVGETQSQAVKIQRGSGVQTATAENDWALGWEHEYRTRTDDAEGSVEISGLPRDNWGIRWEDERIIWGDASSYLNVTTPDHHSVYADLSVYDYVRSGRTNFRAYFDNPREYDRSYGISGDWLSNPRSAGGRKRYRLGLTTGVAHAPGGSGMDVSTDLFGELNFGHRRLGSDTIVRPVLNNYFRWNTTGRQTNTVGLTLDFAHRLGYGEQLGLQYSIDHYSGDSRIDGIEQILQLNYNINRQDWYLYLNATQNLTFQDRYMFTSLNYYPRPEWRCQIAGSYYDFENSLYNEWEFTVARMFGSREIGLSFSEETDRFSLELGGLTNF